MTTLALQLARPETRVWRVGFPPDPWAWSGWEWATNGRFPGRWDDFNGNFRTTYAGSSLLACLLEVLAHFRMDELLVSEIAAIEVDDEDGVLYPTIEPGRVPLEWLDERQASSAELDGEYCVVSASVTLAALHPHFVGIALSHGLKDFDASAVRDARPRSLTQRIASHLYDATELDGVHFASRHGDDLKLWAVFERPEDGEVSPRVADTSDYTLRTDDPAILQAFGMLGIGWADD